VYNILILDILTVKMNYLIITYHIFSTELLNRAEL